jgi:hypothetical protein
MTTNKGRNRKSSDKATKQKQTAPLNSGLIAQKIAGAGSSIYTNSYRFARGKCYVDLETDIANFKANVLNHMCMYLVTDNVIDKWNATQMDNFQDLIVYGAQLLIELKNMYTQTAYAPAVTRSDSTNGSVFTRPTLRLLMQEVAQEIRIPNVCYAIAELYTPVIELNPMSYYNGKPASYFQPFRCNKTAAEMDTLQTNIHALYDAVVYASQSQSKLVPVSTEWVRSITELPLLSWYGNLIATMYPINYDNGGAETESYVEVDETTDLYWFGPLGVPEYFDALALFRSASCADSPKFLTCDSIANDKISIETIADISTTSFTESSRTGHTFKFLNMVQDAMSTSEGNPFLNNSSNYPYPEREHYDNVVLSPEAWNLLAALWLKRHYNDPILKHFALHDIGPDLTASLTRRSGRTSVEASSTAPSSSVFGPPGNSAPPSGGGYFTMDIA